MIDLDSNAGDSNATEPGKNKAEAAGKPPSQQGYATPQGTMGIVLIYLAVMAALWGYMYVILLRSEGFWGGLLGRA